MVTSGQRKRRPGEINCRVCGKPSTERDRVYMGRRCRDCFNRWQRENSKTNPRTKRARLRAQIKFLYGMAIEQWDEIITKQGGKCAICGHVPDGSKGKRDNRLHVDHCHDSGKVRGLLCHHCNVMIGYAAEDGSLLRRAASYVETS